MKVTIPQEGSEAWRNALVEEFGEDSCGSIVGKAFDLTLEVDDEFEGLPYEELVAIVDPYIVYVHNRMHE